MIRSKLLKAVLLGLCMSAFVTNTAFAKMVAPAETTAPSANGAATDVATASETSVNTTTAIGAPSDGTTTRGEALTEDQIALYAKQKEIDQYVFNDHAKELEEKGFSVYSTVVVDNVIEIGIVPYTQESADYLYKALGSEGIKIVEGDISIIYSSGVGSTASGVGYAEAGTVSSTGIDGSPADMPDGAVSLGAPDAKPLNPTDNAILYDGEVPAQSDDTSNVTHAEDDVLMYATSDESQSSDDLKALAAADGLSALPGDTDKKSDGVSTSTTVLVIAGGIIIVGGVGMALKRKRAK